MENIEQGIAWIVENWDRIPKEKKVQLNDYYGDRKGLISGLPEEEHEVVMLLDRQKPSVEASYDFDEERICITKTGRVIWGFDSGCSCPSPWHNSYPECYSCTDTWKEFEVNLKQFDERVIEECVDAITEIKKATV